jgi:hypothetical protein
MVLVLIFLTIPAIVPISCVAGPKAQPANGGFTSRPLAMTLIAL